MFRFYPRLSKFSDFLGTTTGVGVRRGLTSDLIGEIVESRKGVAVFCVPGNSPSDSPQGPGPAVVAPGPRLWSPRGPGRPRRPDGHRPRAEARGIIEKKRLPLYDFPTTSPLLLDYVLV